MNGELLFNGNRVSVWDDEKVLEMDSGDDCTIMCMYLLSLSYTPKMVKTLNFMSCIFCCSKKKHSISEKKNHLHDCL